MIKLAKYLKPYAWLALLCIALVFVQAMADLKLPDYMSDIVNIGVMKNGIEDAVPVKISQESYQIALALMPPESRPLAERYYVPEAAPGAVMCLEYRVPEGISKAQAKLDRTELDAAFSRAFMIRAGALELARAAAANDNLTSEEADVFAQNLLHQLAEMDDAHRADALEYRAEYFDGMGDMVAPQVSAMALQAEYAAIGVDVSAIQRTVILKIGGKMLAFALLVLAAATGSIYVSARVAAGFARDIRQALFEKVSAFSSAEINRFSTASLITRTTNDVQQVQQMVTMMLRMLIYAPVMGLGGVVYAVQKSVSMSWIIALAVLVLLCILALMFLLVTPRFKTLQKLIDRLNLVTRENISGIMVSRAYNTQGFEAGRFDGANQALAKTNLFVQRAMATMMPLLGLIMNATMLLIIWFGAKQISTAAMEVGDMMAYMQYAMHVVISFMFVSMMFIMLPRAAVSAERIAEVLNTESTIHDPARPETPSGDAAMRGLIRFNDVSFRYPGAEQDALSGISFTAKPGEMTAVIGTTGSGKTTLMNLILRFYDVTGGAVEVAGVDVRQLRQHDLRGLMGYVPQKSVLFSGTIAENLRFGAPDLDEDGLRAAAETAQATEFIMDKESGFEEHMSQGGTNVSGGQRQRLSIARALAMKPPILLFDDSFSALDFKTDAALRRALHEQAGDATLFVVAQRVGTIMHAQQIIVLDEGRIVGLGTHKALLETCPTYQEIARSQLREEELHG